MLMPLSDALRRCAETFVIRPIDSVTSIAELDRFETDELSNLLERVRPPSPTLEACVQ